MKRAIKNNRVVNINKLPSQYGILYKLNKNSFHSFSQSPTYNYLSHIQINSTIDLVDKINNIAVSSTLLSSFDQYIIGLFSIGVLIRLIQIPTYYFIKSLNYFYKTRETKSNRYIFKVNLDDHNKSLFFKNMFLNDLKIDCMKRKLTKKEKEFYQEYYTIECFSSYIAQVILLLNNAKVINYFNYKLSVINSVASHSMISNELFLVVLIINYLTLKHSNHPWLINYEKDSLKYFKTAFIVSLPSLMISSLACATWVGYMSTHLCISLYNYRNLQKELKDKSLENYFKLNKPPRI